MSKQILHDSLKKLVRTVCNQKGVEFIAIHAFYECLGDVRILYSYYEDGQECENELTFNMNYI